MAETPLTELETALNDLLSALGVDPPENTRESLATVTDALSVTAEATDETVETVAPANDRTPYSPSRIEEYTACGFRFYVDQLLGINSPERVTRDLDAADRGQFVHATLAGYCERLQTDEDPVDPRGDRGERARLLLDVATELIDDHLDGGATPFAETWLRQCLAGLTTPDENDCYYACSAGVDDAQASEEFQEWLDVQSRFHDYSYRNTLLINQQSPEATRVAGYRT